MDGAIGKEARVGFDFSSELCCSFSPFPVGAAAVAPHIQPGPEEVNAPLNGSAALQCQAEGWPAPRVTWHKDGQLLSLRGSSRYEALQLGGTQLSRSPCQRVPSTSAAGSAPSPGAGLCPVPMPAQGTCQIWLQGARHPPGCVSPCVPGRAQPSGAHLLFLPPSPGCSCCPMAPCTLTLFGCRIPATTSAWPPALLALTGRAWISVSWVSRKVSRIPPAPLLPPLISGQLSSVQRRAAARCLPAPGSSQLPVCLPAVPPAIAPGPPSLTLLAQQPAWLSCDASGSPAPQVRWEKDGRPLNPRLLPGAYRYPPCPLGCFFLVAPP